MRLSTVERVVEKLNDNGVPASVYADYSGRGMYGRTVPGVSLKDFYDYKEAKRLCPILGTVRRDSLGKGMILY